MRRGPGAADAPALRSTDRYLTLGSESEGLYREKASKFIAYAFPIGDEADFTRRLASIAKEHHACRHVCHAWVLGETGDRFRANDAGEPAGTAGRPVLRQLQGAGVTNAALVVVRYFGGTLLGKGGLVHAYAEAARAAIASNTIVERTIRSELRVTCGYALVEALKSDVLKYGGEILEAVYAERCSLRVAIGRAAVPAFTEHWRIAGAEVVPDQAK